MMKLQRYDFELTYTPGKHIVMADALSRATTQSDAPVSSTETDVQLHVNLIAASLPVSDRKCEQIVAETEKDPVLQRVMKNLKENWPRGECLPYYNIRAELSVINGLLLRKNRIVIPQTLRKEMLKRLHEGHLGMEKCKRRARTSVYWPGINADINQMVSSCETCLKHHAKQQKEPMVTTDLPTMPWQKVGTDLFHLDGKNYLLVIDYFSNFPEIALLSSMTATCVITHLKSIFARHGICQILHSDNGPCYNCKDFQNFAEEYDFRHVTSSPLYAQSNGKSEKGVHIVKNLLKKAQESGSDPYLALLSYRASPLEHGMSPAELLMGRRLRTTLPHTEKQKKNNIMRQKQKSLQNRQKANYDKASKCLLPLSKHDTVRVEDSNYWSKKATVLKEVGPRSYTVRTEDGQILRRNRRSLLKTPETLEQSADNELCTTAAPPAEQTKLPPPADQLPASTTTVPPPSTKTDQTPSTPILRRSTRESKPPDRLVL